MKNTQAQSNTKSPDQFDTRVWNTWMTTVNAEEPLIATGEYEARIVGAIVSQSVSSDRPQVDVEYKLIGTEEPIHAYYMLDCQKGIGHLNRWADILGYRLPVDPICLPEFLDKIVEKKHRVLIRVMEHSGFPFAFIMKRLDFASEVAKPEPFVPVPFT